MLGKHSLASNPALCKALLWHRSPHTAALGGCVPISEVPNHSSRGGALTATLLKAALPAPAAATAAATAPEPRILTQFKSVNLLSAF